MLALRTISLIALACALSPAAGAWAQRAQDEQAPQLDAVRRVSQIIGAEVRGRGDESRIAAVSDVAMDRQGRVRYLILGRGGVAGLGDDLIPVPFGMATIVRVEDSGWRAQIDILGEQLEDAPTLGDEENETDTLDEAEFRAKVGEYFQDERGAAAGAEGEVQGPFLLANRLIGTEVSGSGPEEGSIADIEDVLLDAEFSAAYAVLGRGGVADVGEDLIPVPFEMLTIGPSDDGDQLRATIDVPQGRLEEAPKLEAEWNRMLDADFVRNVRTYFEGAGTSTRE